MPALPTVADAAALAAHTGAVVEAIGRYAVVDTGRHRIMHTRADGSLASSTRVVRLVVDGDAWIELWVRPDAEVQALAGRTVIVVGKLIAPPAATGPGARPDPAPSLVEIESIRAAPAP